jgi:hypothetical protein
MPLFRGPVKGAATSLRCAERSRLVDAEIRKLGAFKLEGVGAEEIVSAPSGLAKAGTIAT